jgi:hypothetical protein
MLAEIRLPDHRTERARNPSKHESSGLEVFIDMNRNDAGAGDECQRRCEEIGHPETGAGEGLFLWISALRACPMPTDPREHGAVIPDALVGHEDSAAPCARTEFGRPVLDISYSLSASQPTACLAGAGSQLAV